MQHPRPRQLTADARAPRIGHVDVVLPEHRYSQRELVQVLERRWADQPRLHAVAEKLFDSVAVEERHLALSLEEHANLSDFGEANDAFIRVGTDLGAKAVLRAVARSGLELDEVDAIFFTTVTGVAAPSIDARLVNRLGLRRDVRRTPMFGLGCLGGAAGVARASDYLRGHPDHVAVLLAVELCTLTFQRDFSVANIIASGLFADGAAAVVLTGAEHAPRSSHGLRSLRGRVRPRVVDTRSAFFPDTERVMGWDVGATGFKVVLSADVPAIVREHVPREVDAFLAAHGLTRGDVKHWVCHPGGPKVIAAIEESLGLPRDALDVTRRSLATVGNLSSASVLHVLGETQERAMPGDLGVMMAMGPGFCAEMLLLAW
ncbi:MAG: type III polyketide synthase [Labilithrix sp.]|nr:type III polyketide synthase [Labilithrix sp.]MCW5815342.1 type III polyketide synthase [Labilithrix sp.]